MIRHYIWVRLCGGSSSCGVSEEVMAGECVELTHRHDESLIEDVFFVYGLALNMKIPSGGEVDHFYRIIIL